MTIIGNGILKTGFTSKLGMQPDYIKVGKGFQGRGNICRVFEQPLGSPSNCINDIWDNNHEPAIWGETYSFDCKHTNISNTCCEIPGVIWKWHNLSTGLNLEIYLYKDGIPVPFFINGQEVDHMEYDIPSPPEGRYWLWYFVAAWAGTWLNNTKYEIYDNGNYSWILKEKNGRFDPVQTDFSVINLPTAPPQPPTPTPTNIPLLVILTLIAGGIGYYIYHKMRR